MRVTAALVGGILLACLLGGCGGGHSSDDEDRGTLAVTVNQGGGALQGALVVATGAGAGAGSSQYMASSDANGVARLSDLPDGIYSVAASRSVGANLFVGSGGVLVVSANAVTTASIDVTDAGPDHLPLSLGNEWTFDSMTLSVQSTKQIGAVSAFALARTTGGRPFYLARGANEVYCLGMQLSDGSDRIYRPAVVFFSTVLGEDLATLPDWGTVTVLSRSATVGVPAGQFSDCIEIALTHDGLEERWYLAPGVGPCMIEMLGVGGAVARLSSYVLH